MKLTFVSRMLEVYMKVCFFYVIMEIYLKLTFIHNAVNTHKPEFCIQNTRNLCESDFCIHNAGNIFLVTRDLSWCLSLRCAHKTQIVHVVHSTLRERENSWVVNMESGCCLNRSSPASGSGMNTKECICGVNMAEF